MMAATAPNRRMLKRMSSTHRLTEQSDAWHNEHAERHWLQHEESERSGREDLMDLPFGWEARGGGMVEGAKWGCGR